MKRTAQVGRLNKSGRRYRGSAGPIRLAEVRTVPMTDEQRKEAINALAEILLPFLEEMALEEDVAA